MTPLRNLGYAALIAVLAAAFGTVPTLWSQAKPAGRIGVINIKDVFTRYQKAKEFEDRLEAETKSEKQNIERMDKEIKDLMEEIQILDPSSELRKEKTEKLIQLDSLLKYRVEQWNQKTQQRLNENTALIYNEIRDECDRYGQENGFDLILKSEAARLEVKSKESANQRVNRRSVLYYGKDLDISDGITKGLNDRFAREKAAGGGGGAANPAGGGGGANPAGAGS
ncbi:MAG: OmpH family outer membrane protein [Planctomycetes bacterium]|nr:OmpH family outer membrane protein [Planctomycetota bacterium]